MLPLLILKKNDQLFNLNLRMPYIVKLAISALVIVRKESL